MAHLGADSIADLTTVKLSINLGSLLELIHKNDIDGKAFSNVNSLLINRFIIARSSL